MNILVTGAAGFIGFHTCKILCGQGHVVYGVDNYDTYYDPQLKKDRIKFLRKNFKSNLFNFKKLDIAKYKQLSNFVEGKELDGVINLAAQAGVRHSLDNPFVFGETNLMGFLNVLEICRHNNINKLVYASSSSVYGETEVFPSPEDLKLDTPISLYAATKKANELMAHCYHKLFGLTTVGLRFFNVYGTWNRPDMALGIFARKMTKGEILPVFNHGKSAKDFTYVEDIANGVVKSLDLENVCEVINLGNSKEINLMRFIELIENSLGIKAELNMLPMQPGDVPVSKADNSKAKLLLGWEPTTEVEEGIPRFIEWFKKYYKG